MSIFKVMDTYIKTEWKLIEAESLEHAEDDEGTVLGKKEWTDYGSYYGECLVEPIENNTDYDYVFDELLNELEKDNGNESSL